MREDVIVTYKALRMNLHEVEAELARIARALPVAQSESARKRYLTRRGIFQMRLKQLKKTPNAQRPTPNVERKEPKPLFLAVLTSFAASRGDTPLIERHDHARYITSLNSPSVVWVCVIEADNYDSAVDDANHKLREGKGQITNAGTQIHGFTFPSESSAKSVGKKSGGRRAN